MLRRLLILLLLSLLFARIPGIGRLCVGLLGVGHIRSLSRTIRQMVENQQAPFR
jgi:TM2 domain-containing membrane protein YozV